jgi:hypothetical protein
MPQIVIRAKQPNHSERNVDKVISTKRRTIEFM